MKHLSIYGNPVLDTKQEKIGNRLVPFVIYFDDEDQYTLRNANTEHYKDHIKEEDIPMERIFVDYIKFFGPALAFRRLKQIFNITPVDQYKINY